MKRLLAATALLAIISGCAGMKEAFNEQTCNRDSGYQHGMNDARAGKPMDMGFTYSCYDDVREATRTGYREGYQAGLANLKTNPVSFPYPARATFVCEVSAFTSTFTSSGSTEAEARAIAQNQCLKKYNRMHCEDVTCRR